MLRFCGWHAPIKGRSVLFALFRIVVLDTDAKKGVLGSVLLGAPTNLCAAAFKYIGTGDVDVITGFERPGRLEIHTAFAAIAHMGAIVIVQVRNRVFNRRRVIEPLIKSLVSIRRIFLFTHHRFSPSRFNRPLKPIWVYHNTRCVKAIGAESGNSASYWDLSGSR
jgi:hypothetical protein